MSLHSPYCLHAAKMLVASTLWPMVAGLAWMAIAWPLSGHMTAIFGLVSGGIIAVTSAGFDVLIGPWKERTTLQWMNLWILHEGGRITTSLGVLILLYFAFSPDPGAFLFSYLLCALVTLTATTRIWTRAMRQERTPEEHTKAHQGEA